MITLLPSNSSGYNKYNPRFILENCEEVIISRSSNDLNDLSCYFCIQDNSYRIYDNDINAA